jgi:hypothetical protein
MILENSLKLLSALFKNGPAPTGLSPSNTSTFYGASSLFPLSWTGQDLAKTLSGQISK